MKARVLVVDDDAGVRYTLRGLLEDDGLSVEEAVDGEAALARLDAEPPVDLVLSDLRMPRVDGMELLRRVQARSPAPRVILITAHGSERHAVEAMKLGALDYFRKPFDVDDVLAVVRRALGRVRLEAENERLSSEVNLLRSLVFVSPAMARLALLLQRVGPRDVTVLITGESGTGKERVAEALVRASPRADKPYVRFNCAALTPELAEAELFGHARGAFTGAVRPRKGLFREADGGTLLLDEVGELALPLQAKLLRVLQEGEVRPVGEDRALPVDVRVLAATHRDLPQRVAEGHFREDLYYRLKVVTLQVPALRSRPEDIAALAKHFLARHTERFRMPPVPLTPALLERLTAYRWPGNVRELENVLESAVVLSPDGTLDPELLPGGPGAPATPGPTGATLRERMDTHERELILAALATAQGQRTEAARALGIGRATLHDKLRKHGLLGDEEEPER
ncbi:sigma-54-dependent Fis family transcriptional regulator [Corallococcus praedator]|uniref:Sigma-54-dependent Fis family transcriptional regulator n=1 Tax=Corallococcus praedator TaxID=2316724 RepID=A0ABX9QFR8_9BACT|nr:MULTISPECIES: sigma-54 dependent transcriptional regulator [Corallococcus]RKH13483.1 sigma-54-dependent Fis family transcriptional regulator [Corallococcus sp. CA047B]RKH28308.1 sigma-54-dependent Fis family transcriptional regulator [Corallococcus sp. CA031C]RKI06043.1 sigma-54-dependent Fis family transcriptional regulator [Corallococcus praedator]